MFIIGARQNGRRGFGESFGLQTNNEQHECHCNRRGHAHLDIIA